MKPTVFVTGSAGRIGRCAVDALLAAGFPVTGFDRVPSPGLPPDRAAVGDLTDQPALLAAMRGAGVVVHLAAVPDDARYPRGLPPDDGDNFADQLVPANLVGTYAVLEAARRTGTPRAVLASSVQVVDELIVPGAVRIAADAPARPRYLYACTKVFLEAIGGVYAKDHALDVLAVRFGWCPRDAAQRAELAADPLGQDLYLSPGDVGSFLVAACGVAPEPGRFLVVTATSRPVNAELFDLGPAERELGWRPAESYPAGL